MPPYLLLPLLLSLLLLTCTTPIKPAGFPEGTTTRPADGVAPVAAVTGDVNEMSYRVQTEYPQSIEGCSCALRVDDPTPLEEGYLLVYGYDGPGMIILDGKSRLLQLEGSPRQTIADEQLVSRLENDAYQLTVELTNEGQTGEKVWGYGGSVYAQRKADGKELRFRVIGECGC